MSSYGGAIRTGLLGAPALAASRRSRTGSVHIASSSSGGLEKRRAEPHAPTWARAILASLNPDHLDLGFSEYASYASWVATHHPETVEVVPHRAWTRHPLGPMLGSFGIRILSRWSPAPGLCCPSAFAVRAMKLLGYQYGGFEAGHVRSCGYDAPEHARAYGLATTAGAGATQTQTQTQTGVF